MGRLPLSTTSTKAIRRRGAQCIESSLEES